MILKQQGRILSRGTYLQILESQHHILILSWPSGADIPLKFVNCVNSIGSGLYIEDESVVRLSGFRGSWKYEKPTALANTIRTNV